MDGEFWRGTEKPPAESFRNHDMAKKKKQHFRFCKLASASSDSGLDSERDELELQ